MEEPRVIGCSHVRSATAGTNQTDQRRTNQTDETMHRGGGPRKTKEKYIIIIIIIIIILVLKIQ